MKSLEQFAQDNQKYFKLGDGESFIGSYLGYSYGLSTFDPDKEIAIYKLRRKDSERNIFWQQGSAKIALAFSKLKPGSGVKITRTGSKKENTSYTIEPYNGPVSSFTPENDAIEPF